MKGVNFAGRTDLTIIEALAEAAAIESSKLAGRRTPASEPSPDVAPPSLEK